MSYVRVSIIGTSGNGESWSINPAFDPSGESEGFTDQAALDSACLAIANLTPGANLLSFMSPGFTTSQARLEVRADANDALLAISTQSATTIRPGTGTLKMPPQAAMVISLRTNTPGASGRGRIYWPFTAGAIDSTYRIAGTAQTAALTDFKAYAHSIEAALATAFSPITFALCVRSTKTHASPHVTRLMVGNVVDTQRRRRDNLTEVYASSTYP